MEKHGRNTHWRLVMKLYKMYLTKVSKEKVHLADNN